MEHHQQGNKAALEVVRANETERQTRYPFTSGAIFSLLYLKDHLSREPALTYMTHKNVLILVSFLFLRFISSPHCHESLSSPCLTPCAPLFCGHFVLLCASPCVFLGFVHTLILDLCLIPVLFVFSLIFWFWPTPSSVYSYNFPLSSRSLVISVNLFLHGFCRGLVWLGTFWRIIFKALIHRILREWVKF